MYRSIILYYHKFFYHPEMLIQIFFTINLLKNYFHYKFSKYLKKTAIGDTIPACL